MTVAYMSRTARLHTEIKFVLLYTDAVFHYCRDSALCVPCGICLDVSGRHPAVCDAYWSVRGGTLTSQMVLRCWLRYAVYLLNLLNTYHPFLRSQDNHLLAKPLVYTSFGRHHALSHTAPQIWNDIPLNMRISPSVSSFKHNLKT